MAYGEPTYGESGEVYTDKVRNSLAYVKNAAEVAQATADNAVASVITAGQTADEAREIAEAAKAFVEAPTDDRVAGLVDDPVSATAAALSARHAPKVRRDRTLSSLRTLATGQHNGFPFAVQVSAGEWLVAWRNGANHTPSKGVIQTLRFRDDGTLWTTNTAAVTDATYDLRDPCLTLLSDGRVAMSYFLHDHNTDTPLLDGMRVVFSSDSGATWGTPVTVDSAHTTWAAGAGAVVELADGTLLLPTYGHSAGDTHEAAHVSASTDGGATWAHRAVIASGGVQHAQEPNIIALASGDLLATVRREPSPNNIVTTRSSDDGATWTTPVVAFAGTGSARVTEQAGFLYALYRDVTTGRTMQRVSGDDGATWGDAEELPYLGSKPSCTYGVAVPYKSNSLRYFYSLQSADTLTADIVQTDAIVPEDRTAHGPVACRLRLSVDGGRGGATSVPNNIESIIIFDVEDFDTHGLAGGTGRVTIPTGMDGYYLITGGIYWGANATGQRQACIYKNGALVPGGFESSNPTTSGEVALSVTTVLYLVAGDYIELIGYQNSGGALPARKDGTALTVSLLSPPI